MQKITLSILAICLFSWTNIPNFSKKLEEILNKKWSYIPTGEASKNQKVEVVGEFYISKFEISNGQYLEFLEAIKNQENYQMALPDTTVWSSPNNPNEGFKNQYLRYPGFKNYPVVGVSFEGAKLYCKWLEGSINSKLEESEKIEVRLPSEIEWIRAARGDNNNIPFTWGGPYLENAKGRPLANYKKVSIENSNKSIITTQVFSFLPSKSGVFQMCGNVSEMLNEPNLVKGGSWNSESDLLKIDNLQQISYPSKEVGFRPVIVKKNQKL